MGLDSKDQNAVAISHGVNESKPGDQKRKKISLTPSQMFAIVQEVLRNKARYTDGYGHEIMVHDLIILTM